MNKAVTISALTIFFAGAFACCETKPLSSSAQGTAQIKNTKYTEGAFSSQVAGIFYTDHSASLRKQISGFLKNSSTAKLLKARDVVAILSPHAGYKYSGAVAGEAFRLVEGRDYKTVVVLAPSHRRSAKKATVLLRPAYDTPLGPIKISLDIARKLPLNYPNLFEADESMFEGEHSLEVQLPFIKVALPNAVIVPIILAVRDLNTLKKIGLALSESFSKNEDILFVVSSDMSHHFPYEQAQSYDDNNLLLLERWKISEWIESASKISKGMCGFAPVLAFVNMFGHYPEEKRAVLRLSYKNSGDTAGDKSSVVGYGALAFSLEEGMRNEKVKDNDFGPYGVLERRELMALVKKAVAAAAKGETHPLSPPKSELLKKTGAAFVTLKKQGHLRGCIGHVIGQISLYECVSDVARSATIHDHRFSKITPDELPELTYEISILTTPEVIKSEDVVVGRDGLIMSRGGRSGLLLPQVPIEWNWNREEFLTHTCRKAGLSVGCWKDPETEIKAFRAIVFGEEDL